MPYSIWHIHEKLPHTIAAQKQYNFSNRGHISSQANTFRECCTILLVSARMVFTRVAVEVQGTDDQTCRPDGHVLVLGDHAVPCNLRSQFLIPVRCPLAIPRKRFFLVLKARDVSRSQCLQARPLVGSGTSHLQGPNQFLLFSANSLRSTLCGLCMISMWLDAYQKARRLKSGHSKAVIDAVACLDINDTCCSQ